MRKIRHLSMTFTATLFHILLMLRGGNSIQSCHHKQMHSLMCKHNDFVSVYDSTRIVVLINHATLS